MIAFWVVFYDFIIPFFLCSIRLNIKSMQRRRKNDYGSLHLIHSRVWKRERIEKKYPQLIENVWNGTKKSNNNKIKTFILFELKNRIDWMSLTWMVYMPVINIIHWLSFCGQTNIHCSLFTVIFLLNLFYLAHFKNTHLQVFSLLYP